MGLFDSIMEKLGLKQAQAEAAPKPEAMAEAASKPVAVPVVDIVAMLDGMAQGSKQKLNWKTSIVDLLKLLGLDSSLKARKELAQELGCPPEKIGGDYSQMNIWLHKTVLQKLADNGGNIPKELLD